MSSGLVTFATSGCTPTYAPPVRAVHYGAPGRVRQGDIEVGATMAGVAAPTGGAVHVAVGLHDWASLELGGTLVSAPEGPNPKPLLVMGWVGPRFTLPRKKREFLHGASLLLDGELGIGAGVGGELCTRGADRRVVCDYDGLRWFNRTAFGSYQGGGIGIAANWFAFYGRARIEESSATGIPMTYWPSAMLGLGFDLGSRASLDVGGGYLGYVNATNAVNGWFYQSSVTVRFGTGPH